MAFRTPKGIRLMHARLVFRLRLCLGFVLLVPSLVSAATLDIPGNGTTLSGIGVVSGWKCDAKGDLTIRFNGGDSIPLLYGSERGDVRNAGACPDANVGFVAVMNWGNLGDGEHTAIAYDNGKEFARSTFTVVTTGAAFRTDLEGEWTIPQFPDPGDTARFVWNTGTQHFELVSVRTRPVDRSIVKYLTGPVAAGKSPGAIAAIIDEAGVRAIASAGVRKQGSPEKFTIHDQVAIGSNSKAMTSTMLATLVEDGTFVNGWETTLAEVFPELVDKIHPGYHPVTLWQLVSHTSGMPIYPPDLYYHTGRDVEEKRYKIVRENLTHPPAGPIGEFEYSNLGYMVAGAMAEQLTGKSWETLMEERLFTPLGMYSAGFGAPGTPNEVDQPWGHERKGDSWVPSQIDYLITGPAGTVYLSIADWAKFIQLWFPSSEPKILDREALNTLITPRSGNYAAGWRVSGHGDIRLEHGGSNGYWLSNPWIVPNRERAYIAVVNAWEDPSAQIVDMINDITRSLENHSQSSASSGGSNG